MYICIWNKGEQWRSLESAAPVFSPPHLPPVAARSEHPPPGAAAHAVEASPTFPHRTPARSEWDLKLT